MAIFKDWFSKLVKSSSPDSNDNDDDDSTELQAYIVLGVDMQGDSFISCNFAPNYSEEMAHLIFLLYSGGMMKECVESLNQACSSELEAQLILQHVAALLHEYRVTQETQLKPSTPVVDPCEVFNTGERNDFKG